MALGGGAMSEIGVSDRLKENYEGYYECGDSEWRWLCALGKAQSIVSLHGDLPRRSVLEIGAGDGSILRRLSEASFSHAFHALEISPSAVATIERAAIPRLVECKLFDGYQIPYEDSKFDLAILSHVIEHVEHPRQLLYEASRVARYVFVEVPLEDTLRMPRDFVFDPVGHINFYSRKSIRRLVQSCELRVLREKVTTPAKGAYIYRSGGMKGRLIYHVKQMLLRLNPGLATRVSTYHGALICEREVRRAAEPGGRIAREYSRAS